MIVIINKYVEKKYTHFNTVGDGEGSEVEIVKMYVNDLYSYCSMDVQRNIPTLDLFGRSPSARISTG